MQLHPAEGQADCSNTTQPVNENKYLHALLGNKHTVNTDTGQTLHLSVCVRVRCFVLRRPCLSRSVKVSAWDKTVSISIHMQLSEEEKWEDPDQMHTFYFLNVLYVKIGHLLHLNVRQEWFIKENTVNMATGQIYRTLSLPVVFWGVDFSFLLI